jgi:hypothetical protein
MAYDFPASPTTGQVYGAYTYDGEKWLATAANPNLSYVRYDLAQGLTANQMAQARSNIALTKKNYIVNGAMQISQENGTANLTANNAFATDQFQMIFASATGTMNSTQKPGVTPSGSLYRYRFAANPVNSAIGASEFAMTRTTIEGLRFADLRFGSTAAKTVTLQFGVNAAAGTYCICFRNSALDRAYVAEYVIAAGESLNDVVKSVTIPGDTLGTWLADNRAGLYIDWIIAAGSALKVATAGSWGASNIATANQSNGIAVTTGFELFDVSLTEGSVAPPFQLPDYASELALCKRYWQKFNTVVVDTTSASQSTIFPVEMRASPTVTGGGAGFTVAQPSPGAAQFYQTGRNYATLLLNARL